MNKMIGCLSIAKLLILLTIWFPFSGFTAQPLSGNSKPFCDYLFIDGGFAEHKKSEYVVYDGKSRSKLITKINIKHLPGGKLQIKDILNHQGQSIGVKAAELRGLSGVMLNDGAGERPFACPRIAFLNAKSRLELEFKPNVSPASL